MGYKGDSCMDCGYFLGGYSEGLMYIPPCGSKDKPGIIPWSVLLPDEPDENDLNEHDLKLRKSGNIIE